MMKRKGRAWRESMVQGKGKCGEPGKEFRIENITKIYKILPFFHTVRKKEKLIFPFRFYVV